MVSLWYLAPESMSKKGFVNYVGDNYWNVGDGCVIAELLQGYSLGNTTFLWWRYSRQTTGKQAFGTWKKITGSIWGSYKWRTCITMNMLGLKYRSCWTTKQAMSSPWCRSLTVDPWPIGTSMMATYFSHLTRCESMMFRDGEQTHCEWILHLFPAGPTRSDMLLLHHQSWGVLKRDHTDFISLSMCRPIEQVTARTTWVLDWRHQTHCQGNHNNDVSYKMLPSHKHTTSFIVHLD